MESEVDRRRDTPRGGHQAVLDDARFDDVRDGPEFLPRALVCRRLSPGEEARRTQDQGPGADARDRLLRPKVEELLEELGILHDLRASRPAWHDDEIQVRELSVDLVSEELHAEGARDLFLQGPKADCQVELRVDLLRLGEDLVHADRVELLDAIEDQNADPHGSGVSVVWLNRSAPNGASVDPRSSCQNTSMSPWTSSPCSVMLYGFTDRGCFSRRILITCMTSCTSPFSRSLKRSPMTPSDTYSTRPSREDRGLSSFTSAVKMQVASVDLSCLHRANSFSRRSLSSAKSMFNRLTESIATRDAPLRLMKSGSSGRFCFRLDDCPTSGDPFHVHDDKTCIRRHHRGEAGDLVPRQVR